jgi:muconate cycloisomerase
MKIIGIETIPIRLPTRRVHQWASLTTPIGVYVIIKLYTDEGLIGLGEAPVLKDWGGDHGKYFGETPQTTAHIINDILAPALAGQDPGRFESIHALMDKAVKGYPYCKAAIDAALYDVVGDAETIKANMPRACRTGFSCHSPCSSCRLTSRLMKSGRRVVIRASPVLFVYSTV